MPEQSETISAVTHAANLLSLHLEDAFLWNSDADELLLCQTVSNYDHHVRPAMIQQDDPYASAMFLVYLTMYI